MKMTEGQAYAAVGLLAGGCKGWKDASTDAFVEQFIVLVDDPEAMTEVCRTISTSWREPFPPALADVMREYHNHPRVKAEREARVAETMLDESVGAMVSVSEGWAIANDAYRAAYGRNIGEAPVANPELAETLIINCKRRDRHGNWHARYLDVLAGFHGDQARAGASLDAIGRRVSNNRGNLVLRPPEPATVTPEPPARRSGLGSAATPSPPSERPPDPGTTLAEAIGMTISRMEGDQ